MEHERHGLGAMACLQPRRGAGADVACRRVLKPERRGAAVTGSYNCRLLSAPTSTLEARDKPPTLLVVPLARWGSHEASVRMLASSCGLQKVGSNTEFH